NDAGPGKAHEIAHGAGWRVGVDAERYGPQALRGELRPEPLGLVVAEQRDSIATPETQLGQTERDVTHVESVLLPGIRLPDPEALPPERHAIRSLGGLLQQQLGEGVTLQHKPPPPRACGAPPPEGPRRSSCRSP